MNDFFEIFTVIGLAQILEAAGGSTVMLHWDERSPDACIESDTRSLEDAAEIVKAHARAHAADESWVGALGDLAGNTRAALSPRVGRPSNPEEWRAWQSTRHDAIDRIQTDDIADFRMVGALGEPAYWSVGREAVNPDHGASQWEMKTRNRGEEFVQNRLRLLAQTVSAWDVARIAEGLGGGSLNDDLGKNSRSSRTPTGLRAPGPADNAAAWCALWGMSAFPVRPVAPSPMNERPRSRTSGAWRMGQSTFVAVPIAARPVTLSRLRTVVRNAAMVRVAAAAVAQAENEDDESLASALAKSTLDRAWLARHGIAGLAIGCKQFTDNVNAPEAWIDFVAFEAVNSTAIPTSTGTAARGELSSERVL